MYINNTGHMAKMAVIMPIYGKTFHKFSPEPVDPLKQILTCSTGD